MSRYITGTNRNGTPSVLDTETGTSYATISNEAPAIAAALNAGDEAFAREFATWSGTHDPEGFTPTPTTAQQGQALAREFFDAAEERAALVTERDADGEKWWN